MGHQVRGVIARTERAPVELVTVLVPDPGPGEVLVRVQACGVCHTDLHYREGSINDEFPFLLGHEAAGKVEAVGPDVANLAPGDFVVLAWRAPCGQCRSCLRGRPWYCFDSRNASQKMTLEDGTRCRPPSASAPSPSAAWSPPARRSRSTRPPGPRRPGWSAAASWPASGRS
jgi:S-(hydroxymethyl)mycothiol dehydrogenase